MTLPIYPWQEPYLAAAQETDDSKIPGHLLEAIAAIEQRLLSPIDVNSLEYKAIENTRRGSAEHNYEETAGLRREWLDWCPSVERSFQAAPLFL